MTTKEKDKLLVSIEEYYDVLGDRPYKFSAEEVGYGPAPEGSAMRCASCLHFYRRQIDGFSVCEIFRNEETDQEGVRGDYRCRFWTVDVDVHPLLNETEDT